MMKVGDRRTLAILLSVSITPVLSFLCGPALGADIHASPDGRPDGDGSRAKPLDIFTALSDRSPARPGDTIHLLGGTYEGRMSGRERIPFEAAVSGTKEKPIRVMPVPGEAAHLNGAVELRGSYAHYIGLEIGDLKWDPHEREHRVPTALNVTAGAGAKVINCNIFGGSMGTGCWSGAVDLELYGNLIHDFGVFGVFGGRGRGHGHAYYAQNERGTKVFMHNIAYRGCGWHVHVYTQAGRIHGFDIVENICTIAGARKPGQTVDSFLIAGYSPADRIRLTGNVGYQPSDEERWRPNARLSAFRNVENGTAQVEGNCLMGAFFGLSLGRWRSISVTGNTIWSTGILAEISSGPTGSAVDGGAKPDLRGYAVDGNTYIPNGRPKPFRYASREKVKDDDLLTFAEWQALGLDRSGRFLKGRDGRPTGAKVFVFPNKYEKGRAHVGVFNWDGVGSVDVDLGGVMAEGERYRIYNCLDIEQTIRQCKPILSGTYRGGTIRFPMRRAAISPDFDAFLVLPAGRS